MPPPTRAEIVQDITAKIRSGEYPVGSKLPPARVLAENYGVHIATVQRATDVLRERGIVVGQAGRGVFVVKVPDDS